MLPFIKTQTLPLVVQLDFFAVKNHGSSHRIELKQTDRALVPKCVDKVLVTAIVKHIETNQIMGKRFETILDDPLLVPIYTQHTASN